MATYGRIRFFDDNIAPAQVVFSTTESMESFSGENGHICVNSTLGNVFLYVGSNVSDGNTTYLWIPMSSNPASESAIDSREEGSVITPANLEYAVRSVLPSVVRLPQKSTGGLFIKQFSVYDDLNYVHQPVTNYVEYDLPEINDSEDSLKLHEINIEVDFTGFARFSSGDSGNAYAWKKGNVVVYTNSEEPSSGSSIFSTSSMTTQDTLCFVKQYNSSHDEILQDISVSFYDYGDNEIQPASTLEISNGDIVNYVCRWSHSRNEWCVMPVLMAKRDNIVVASLPQ